MRLAPVGYSLVRLCVFALLAMLANSVAFAEAPPHPADHHREPGHKEESGSHDAGAHGEAKEHTNFGQATVAPRHEEPRATPTSAPTAGPTPLPTFAAPEEAADPLPTKVAAPKEPSGGELIDAILVLDASGSMRETDPGRLRDEGARLFTQFLKPGDRFGIVEFAERARVIRPLGEFDAKQLPVIQEQLAKVGNSGLYTDIYSALETARTELKSKPRAKAKPMIVLLSDGKMEPDPKIAATDARLNELRNQLFPELRAGDVRVHTLAFSELADRELLKETAASTDGVFLFAADADQIHEQFANMFVLVKKPQMVPLTSKGFRIDGDVKEATFYINRADGRELTLVSPGGENLTATRHPAAVRWYASKKFDVVTVTEPEPGDWTVQGVAQQEGFATLLTNLKLVLDWQSTFSAGSNQLLQARLYDDDRPVELPDMSDSIRFAFQIIPTDKVSEPVVRDLLVDNGESGDQVARDGIFSRSVHLEEPGEYRLNVLARGPTFERSQQVAFRIKPPLLWLSVVERTPAEIAAIKALRSSRGTGHGGGHGEEEEEEGEEEAHEVHEPDPVYFRVELSAEGTTIRKPEVTLVAVDKKHRRVNIPLERSTSGASVYEGSPRALPGGGTYELQATIVGTGNNRKMVSGTTRTVTYEHHVAEAHPHVDEHVEPTHEAPEAVETIAVVKKKVKSVPTPLWMFLVVVTICNVIAFVVALKLAKSAGGGTESERPPPPPLDELRAFAKSLRAKLGSTELPALSAEAAGGGTFEAAVPEEEAPPPADEGEAPAEAVPEGGEEAQAGEISAEETPAEETEEQS